jgi:uncharacterized membrane protein
MTDQNRPSVTALDAIIPTNPLAAISCWVGIASVVLCGFGVVLGPIAVLLGMLSMKKWKMQESAYGAKASKLRTWIGIVSGGLGTVIGIVMLIVIINNR